MSLALKDSLQVRDVCAAKFKDYQFGLKLIAQNTGQQEFEIDRDAVENPDKPIKASIESRDGDKVHG